MNMIGAVSSEVFRVPKFLKITGECACGGRLVNGECGACDLKLLVAQEEKERERKWYALEVREEMKKRRKAAEREELREDNRSKQYKD